MYLHTGETNARYQFLARYPWKPPRKRGLRLCDGNFARRTGEGRLADGCLVVDVLFSLYASTPPREGGVSCYISWFDVAFVEG